jgi:ABC-2 type transport system permease protein
MRGASVIAGKDLRTIFMSPLFYVVTGICSIAWNMRFFFVMREFRNSNAMQQMGLQQGDGPNLHFNVIAGHISMVNLMMIFAIAAMTMRLFTEERRNRTFDLLLTAPVTSTEIIVGKFIAGVLTAWAIIAVSLIPTFALAFYGKLEWGPLVASIIGLLLVGAAYTAVGMFASSLTESAVLSVLMGLIFNVMLWFVGAATDISDDPVTRSVFEHVNIGTHFMNFIRGSVTISSFVFFASVIFLFAFLTQRVIESMRWR